MKVIIEQHDSFTSPNNNLTSNDRDILKRCKDKELQICQCSYSMFVMMNMHIPVQV